MNERLEGRPIMDGKKRWYQSRLHGHSMTSTMASLACPMQQAQRASVPKLIQKVPRRLPQGLAATASPAALMLKGSPRHGLKRDLGMPELALISPLAGLTRSTHRPSPRKSIGLDFQLHG